MTREEEKYTTLDTEQCKWWVNHLFNMAKEKACNSHNFDDAEEMQSAQNKIIKALEQEPCEDFISRKAILNMSDFVGEMPTYSHPYDNLKEVVYVEDIESLPPVTPTQKWISCSERLPKENEYVGDVCKYYLIQDEFGDMHVAHYKKIGWIPVDSLKALGDEIVAWMPLPKPYKAESEDKE